MSASKLVLLLALSLLSSCCPVAIRRLLRPGEPKAPPPVSDIVEEEQVLHVAISGGYLRGLPGEANFRRKFQLRLDGDLVWEGWLAFGDAQSPADPQVAWLPTPVRAARGAHEFRIYDVTIGSEIAGTYACAHEQCWVVVSYAADINRLDLIEFQSERPSF